jgi:hypothetical protein
LHYFIKDIHRYVPKKGFVLEEYVISVLANCIQGRTVGIMDKPISRKKAEEKIKAIQEEIMDQRTEENLYLICMDMLSDVLYEKFQNFNYKIQIQIEIYGVYILPIVQLFIDGTIICSDKVLEEKNLWERIEIYYLDIIFNRFMVEPSYYDLSQEHVLSKNNIEEAIEIYDELKKIINEMRQSVMNIILKLPMFDILDK